MGIAGTLVVMGLVYWIGIGVRSVAGAAATPILLVVLLVLYLWLLRISARHPDLPTDINITNPVRPEAWPTIRSGLYYLDSYRHSGVVPGGRPTVRGAFGFLGGNGHAVPDGHSTAAHCFLPWSIHR